LYEPGSGTIHLDGRDITQYRIKSLRKRITPLTQETFLFRATIGENIAFGRRRATQHEVETAATLVGADDFIRRLPEGYETLVGEGGLTLSGGQRQRISFARAALRSSPIMIFDEPATGLDVHAEREAKEVLRTLGTGRTLIMITHRLHFLDQADWVVFIRDGRLVEEGTPDALVTARGEFFEFVNRGQDQAEVDAWLNGIFPKTGNRE
jgi:ABC-type multidrug transport system fused ATPase/permease subunit